MNKRLYVEYVCHDVGSEKEESEEEIEAIMKRGMTPIRVNPAPEIETKGLFEE